MDRRSFLLRAGALATTAVLLFQRLMSNPAQEAADRIAALGFTVGRVGSRLVAFNVWQPTSDESSNMVGWIMHDGSVRWIWDGLKGGLR